MATSSDTELCNICLVKKQTTVSQSWCPECQEALCPGCEEHHSTSKATRKHTTISINDYMRLPKFILNVKLVCEEHDKKFKRYCKNHECLLCKKCVKATHVKCKDIVLLDDVTSNIKTSYTLEAIQKDIEDICHRIKEMQNDRKENFDKISKQKQKIKQEISDFRSTINKHLDNIENDLLRKLESETETQSRRIRDLINKLKDKENRMTEMQENLNKMIKYATDFQTFLGSKQIEKQIHTEEGFIRSLCDDESLKEVEICCDINKQLKDVTEKIKIFGEISIKTSPGKMDVTSLRERQAQISLKKKTLGTEKRLKLLQSFDISKLGIDKVSCCCLINNKDMVIADFSNKITIYTTDGNIHFKLNLKSSAIDITIISDKTIAAVCSRRIIFIDTDNGIIKESICTTLDVWGITYRNERLIYCEEHKGITVIDLKTSKTRIWLKEKLKAPLYITAFGENSERFALMESKKKTVRVFDSESEELWRLSQTGYLQDPRNIFADKKDFLFVLDRGSQSIVCISPDGKNHSVLKSDECTFKANRISYNASIGQLLVCTTENKVLVFSI